MSRSEFVEVVARRLAGVFGDRSVEFWEALYSTVEAMSVEEGEARVAAIVAADYAMPVPARFLSVSIGS